MGDEISSQQRKSLLQWIPTVSLHGRFRKNSGKFQPQLRKQNRKWQSLIQSAEVKYPPYPESSGGPECILCSFMHDLVTAKLLGQNQVKNPEKEGGTLRGSGNTTEPRRTRRIIKPNKSEGSPTGVVCSVTRTGSVLCFLSRSVQITLHKASPGHVCPLNCRLCLFAVQNPNQGPELEGSQEPMTLMRSMRTGFTDLLYSKGGTSQMVCR